MSSIRTSLTRHVAYTPMSDDEIRTKADKLWRETNGQAVMVRLDWITNDLDRQHVKNIGEKLYGGRNS